MRVTTTEAEGGHYWQLVNDDGTVAHQAEVARQNAHDAHAAGVRQLRALNALEWAKARQTAVLDDINTGLPPDYRAEFTGDELL